MEQKLDKIEYSSVTEVTGNSVTAEQIQRMYTRYHFASEFCKGKNVLEVACGSGQGLGFLAECAESIVGGDYDEKLVKCANKYYKGNIEITQLDAHNLRFKDNRFDVVILFEAIYYLLQPEKFVSEAYRILRKKGVLIMCTVNKDWYGFNPSPYSHKYFSASELSVLLKQNGFDDIKLYGNCLATANTTKGKIVSTIKHMAVALNLIPKTMKGKEFFKRIFMGKLVPLPPEIKGGMAEYVPPIPIPNNVPNIEYKVIFAVAYAR